jgi:hypothetical protein
VRLIEDKNLEAVAGRGKDGALSQIAGVVYTVVAGSVDFNYV